MGLFAGVAVPPVRSGFTKPRSMVWPFASTGDPENVRRSHVDREHPRGIPRYAVIQQIEHVTLPRWQRHAERRQATRARGAPRFEIRVVVDGYENRSRNLPLNHGGTGAALPAGTALPTGTSTACAPTAACRKCDGECQGEQQVKHLPIGFRRCSHAFFPLYYFLFVSELRSKARVAYRKMILAAERTPPFSVPWTCNLMSGCIFAAVPPAVIACCHPSAPVSPPRRRRGRSRNRSGKR